MSTSPPRTAIWPRSSTRSTRSYPASASSSTSVSRSRLSACVSRMTSGSLVVRRHPLRERACGDADEPAGGREPRAREPVRRRDAPGARGRNLQRTPRLGRSATVCRVDVPADRLGNVTRFLVLGRKGRRAGARASRGASRGATEARARRHARPRERRQRTRESARSRASSSTSPPSGVDSRRVDTWSMRPAGTASRRVIVAPPARRPGLAPTNELGSARPRAAAPNCPQGHSRVPSTTVPAAESHVAHGSVERVRLTSPIRPARRLVVAALSLLEPFANDRLDRIGSPPDDSVCDPRAVRRARARSRRRHGGRLALDARPRSADAGNPHRRAPARSTCSPLWPASPPPARACIRPSSRSTSS